MKRWFFTFLAASMFITSPIVASADVSGLVPCKDSAVFKKRLDGSVKKLTARLDKYEPETPAYLAIQEQIDKTQARFTKYGKQGLLCGADGLPHLIADGRGSHAGEFIPFLVATIFILIATIWNWQELEPIQRILYPLWILGMCLPTF